MKYIFTLLLTVAVGLSASYAQGNGAKSSGNDFSIEQRLGLDNPVEKESTRRSLGSAQAKQLDGALSALSGYGNADNTVDIPFTLELTNTDLEYGDSINISFPNGFTINSVSNDDVFGPSFDDDPDNEDGDPEAFNGISMDGQSVSWGDNDNSWGGITAGGIVYNFVINVTVDAGVSGDQTINYHVSGDGFADPAGDLDGTVTISGGLSVAGVVINSADHNTLEVAVDAAGLSTSLGTFEPTTLFAPTDDAFDALEAENPGIIAALLADPEVLTDILLYHVAPVEAFSGDLTDGQMVTTVQGQDVVISIVGEDVFVNNVLVSIADLDATNGVVHVIDAVLVPSTDATLPLDFELPSIAYDFLAFGGAASTIIDNPDQSGINESGQVMETVRGEAGTPSEVFAGVFINLAEPINWESNNLLIDTWSPDAGITVRAAVENQEVGLGSQVAVDVQTTVENGWETLSFDFSGIDPGVEYDRVVVIFNQEVAGTGETYYFDNVRVEQLPTIFEIVEGSDVHSTLETALVESGLDAATNNPDADLTLFAPTDDAFDALPAGVLDALLDDVEGALVNVLLHHVVGGTNLSGDLMDGMEVLTLQGETVEVSIQGGDVFIISGGVTAQVTAADLNATNGVVHVIDAVLVPEFCTVVNNTWPTLLNDEGAGAPVADGGICPINYSDFESWASEAYQVDNFVAGTTYTFGLAGADEATWDPSFLVQNGTTGEIIATQDEGFSITFEVPVDGTYLLIIHEQGLCGTQSDNLETDNGTPYLTCESSVTITDIVVASEDHNTLETAVTAAGLGGTLAGEGPFTLFAPTDEAFAAIDPDVLQSLLDDPTGLLTEVLQHHVVGAIAYSNDLSDGQMVPTLNGEDVTIGVDDDITVTSALGAEATVTVADIVASNGVVHVIDVVLTPSLLSVDELKNVTDFRMFPNPANNEVSVELQMTQSEDLTIDVVNILGQSVKSFDFGTRSAGFNRELLNVNDLPEGMYILNITVGEDQATTKLQITR